MIKQTLAAGVFAVATGFAFAGAAHAEDFPATPLQHGAPTDLPGERLIPGVAQAAAIVNGVTQPILQPLLAPEGAAAPAAGPAAHRGHHHWRHVAHRRGATSHQASLRRRARHVS